MRIAFFRRSSCRSRPATWSRASRPLLAAALPLLTLAATPEAGAQSREVYIGATPDRSGGYAGRRSLGVGRLEFEAEGLLDQARRSLERGNPMEARQVLEMVIERYAQTPAADEARRMLAPIYSASAGPAGAPLRPSTEASPRHTQTPEPPPAIHHDASRDELERPWNTEVRHGRNLEKDFRTNVGDRVFFGDASIELGAKARVVLAAQAAWLKRYPSLAVTIESHADDRGSRELNSDLAQRRGEAVRARLIEEGVEPQRIKLSVLGRDAPVAPCPDPACAAQNRRVITLIGDGSVPDSPSRAGTGAARRLTLERSGR